MFEINLPNHKSLNYLHNDTKHMVLYKIWNTTAIVYANPNFKDTPLSFN